ncbi:MAG: GNAT family N-acetyltransferase [Planctomycetota bacterium]
MTKVRSATIEDAPSIASFQIAMAQETENKQLDRKTVETAVEAVFDDPGKGFYLIAERGDEVCGSLLVTFEWSDWRNSNLWYIQSVYVSEPFRGQGIFKSLYQAVYELAVEQDVMFIRLYVETENEVAQKVYEKLGMKRMPYFMYDVRVSPANGET